MREFTGTVLARAATALAALLVAAAMVPAMVSANVTVYLSGDSGGTGDINGRHGDVSRSLLTSSGANSNSCSACQIWAGAHYAGGLTLYANWAMGNGEACHNYGTSNIGAMVETPYTRQDINALAGWAGPNGTYC